MHANKVAVRLGMHASKYKKRVVTEGVFLGIQIKCFSDISILSR